MTLATTQVLQSHYHTPSLEAARAIPIITRAGHLKAGPNYRISRRRSPGHDLLYCVRGAGSVSVGSGTFRVGAGELTWINGYEAHAHWPDPENPWEVLWFRIDGAGLASLHALLGVGADPVFRNLPAAEVRQCFKQINARLGGNSLYMESDVHPIVAKLVSILWRSRQGPADASQPRVPKRLETVLNRMAVYPDRKWTAADLARLSGLSVAQFYRIFRQATGSSPVDWLRRERISLAKRRLQETEDPVKSVADQVGYNSPFFFSRDFKRYTGLSPSEFRAQEHHAPAFN